MNSPKVLLLLLIVALLAWGFKFGGQLPKAYHARSCRGRDWRRAFPAATKHEIREFLSFFVGAFAYNDREKLKLAPTDEIRKLYRAQYPSRVQPDAMELETLARELGRMHGLELEALWKDNLTLGELFSRTLERRAAAK
ncbi:hypothetical protein EH244_31665 [Variovorax beijingensis]|uniref:Uncharacterized protein n=1 Tax=Variovorax beijingensis TaxID=2496117 RepID=A0A3P3DZS9_9BURK|nr:hypothetical protein [Variovorax beijingensis]RRH79740.1 hypothetical protein EH244_31665 [Variovorax beijingensis]